MLTVCARRRKESEKEIDRDKEKEIETQYYISSYCSWMVERKKIDNARKRERKKEIVCVRERGCV